MSGGGAPLGLNLTDSWPLGVRLGAICILLTVAGAASLLQALSHLFTSSPVLLPPLLQAQSGTSSADGILPSVPSPLLDDGMDLPFDMMSGLDALGSGGGRGRDQVEGRGDDMADHMDLPLDMISGLDALCQSGGDRSGGPGGRGG